MSEEVFFAILCVKTQAIFAILYVHAEGKYI